MQQEPGSGKGIWVKHMPLLVLTPPLIFSLLLSSTMVFLFKVSLDCRFFFFITLSFAKAYNAETFSFGSTQD